MRHPARGSRREKLPLRREFVRERNGSKVIPMTHDSPMRIEIGYVSCWYLFPSRRPGRLH